MLRRPIALLRLSDRYYKAANCIMPLLARLVRKARITAQALMRHIAPCNVAAPGKAGIFTVHHGRVWAGDPIPKNQAVLWHEDCELIDPILIDDGPSAHQANVLEGVLPGNLVRDENKVSSLEIKCHPEQSGSGLVGPLEPPMITACKAAIREEISKVTIEINDLRFQVRMTLYSHVSGGFRPFEGRCEALG